MEGDIINNHPAAPTDRGDETEHDAGVIFPNGNIEEGTKNKVGVEGVFSGLAGGKRSIAQIYHAVGKSEVGVLREELPQGIVYGMQLGREGLRKTGQRCCKQYKQQD